MERKKKRELLLSTISVDCVAFDGQLSKVANKTRKPLVHSPGFLHRISHALVNAATI